MGLFDVLGSIGGGVISGIGSVVGGLINSGAQAEANKQNLEEAARNRDFQRDMANTAYQRAIVDMKKAGINPMLAYSQGGASAPAGNMANVQSTRPGDAVSSGISGGVSSALQTYQSLNQVELLKSQKALNAAQEVAAVRDAQLKESSALNVQQQTKIASLEALKRVYELPKQKVQSEVEQAHGQIDKSNAKYDNWLKRIGDTLNTAGSALDVINPLRYIRGGGGGSPSGGPSGKGPTILKGPSGPVIHHQGTNYYPWKE